MTKAILVIDMPKSCIECEILNHEELTCIGMKVHFSNLNNIQVFCPLKPMPEKKIHEPTYYAVEGLGGAFELERHKGYNKCIDEILGEEE